MRSNKWLALLAVVACAGYVSAGHAAPRVELVSRGALPSAMPSDGNSDAPALSANGRYIAFQSTASTFGIADTNRTGDIYLYDRTPGTFSLLSRRGPTLGDRGSSAPAISADGSRVVFISAATTLDPADANGISDVFVLERVAGTLRRLTPAAGVEANDAPLSPQISADGRYVAFTSLASNWVAGDVNSAYDVFVYDLVANTVVRASVGNAGEALVPSVPEDFPPSFSLSAGGRCVAFDTATALEAADTTGATDVYLRNLDAGTTTRVSVNAAGVAGNSDSGTPWVSPDCLSVAFTTRSNNLHPDGVPNYSVVALQKTIASGVVTRIWPAVADPASGQLVLQIVGSRDGNHLAVTGFTTGSAAGLPREPLMILWRRSDGALTVPPATLTGFPGGVQDGGAFVAYGTGRPLVDSDLNAFFDVALYDVAGVSLIPVTLPPSPVVASTGNGSSGLGNRLSPLLTAGSTRNQFISDDGLLIAFASIATNLVTGDNNKFEDVFVADRRTGVNQRVTRGFAGGESNGDSSVHDMSPDGRYLVVDSCASNLVSGDTNAVCDLFFVDRSVTPPTVERVSVSTAGTQADRAGPPSGGYWGSLSADARYVVFASDATNLVAGDTNARTDIFLRDRTAGTTTMLTRSVGATPGLSNGPSTNPRISADGRYVVFRSSASNLVAPIPPADPVYGRSHMYVLDVATSATELVSVTSEGVPVAGAERGFISSDGRYVAFVSLNDGYVPGDADGKRDVFVRDLLLDKTTQASLKPDGTDWSVGTFIGGLSTRGLLVPFIVDEGESFGGAGYSYDISTGRVDRIYAAPAGFSQTLRLFASPQGRHVTFAHNGVLTSSDQNGAVYDVYMASDFTTGIDGGASGAAPELALAGSPKANAEMGDAVAVSERYIVAGAPGANEVYIFERPAGSTGTTMRGGIATAKASNGFNLIATIAAPGGGAFGDKWGSSVAMTSDGGTLVIGVPGVGAGQVAVFQEPDGGWNSTVSAVQTINAPAASGDVLPDDFGTSVGLASDGRVVIGAPTTDVFGQADAGMVAVYAPLAGGTYANTPTQTFNAPIAQAGASFGAEVEATPTAFAVGAPLQDDGGSMDEGAVYTYASGGTNVPFVTAAVISPPDGGALGDKWGTGIGLTGNTLVIGAPGDDTAGTDTGAAYVYESPSGSFGSATPSALVPERTTGGEAVGMSVEAAGDYVVVGAPLSDRLGVADTGTAFVFERPERGWNVAVSHLADIELRASESQIDQEFGDSVAVTAQGLVIGVPQRDVDARPDQGEADTFVFDRISRLGYE